MSPGLWCAGIALFLAGGLYPLADGATEQVPASVATPAPPLPTAPPLFAPQADLDKPAPSDGVDAQLEYLPPSKPPGNPRPDLNPDATRDCRDFTNWWEAQAWWSYWRYEGHASPGGLLVVRDGFVCVDLPPAASETEAPIQDEGVEAQLEHFPPPPPTSSGNP